MSYVGKASAFPGIRLHVEPTTKSSEKTERTSTPPTSRLLQEHVASTQPSSPSQLASSSNSEQVTNKSQQPPLQYQKVIEETGVILSQLPELINQKNHHATMAGRKGCEIAEMLSNYGSLMNSTSLPVESIFGKWFMELGKFLLSFEELLLTINTELSSHIEAPIRRLGNAEMHNVKRELKKFESCRSNYNASCEKLKSVTGKTKVSLEKVVEAEHDKTFSKKAMDDSKLRLDQSILALNKAISSSLISSHLLPLVKFYSHFATLSHSLLKYLPENEALEKLSPALQSYEEDLKQQQSLLLIQQQQEAPSINKPSGLDDGAETLPSDGSNRRLSFNSPHGGDAPSKPRRLSIKETTGTTEQERKNTLLTVVVGERDYIHNLNSINLYREALKKEEDSLIKENEKNIFMNVEEIYSLHQPFWQELESILKKWTTPGTISSSSSLTSNLQPIVHLFLQKLPVFEKVYREYMKQHVEEAPHLDSMRKQSKQLNNVLKITQEKNGVLGLTELLKLPTQRLDAYVSFLSSLLKTTTTTEEKDRKMLEDTLDRFKDLMSSIKIEVKEIENTRKMMEIDSTLIESTTSLISPGRKFVREGPVQLHLDAAAVSPNSLITVHSPTPPAIDPSKDKVVVDYCFLFNDILLFVQRLGSGGVLKKQHQSQYKVIHTFRLSKVVLLDTSDGNSIAGIEQKNSFKLIYGEKQYIFHTSNELQKAEWLNDIIKAIQHVEKKNKVFGVPIDVLMQREKTENDIPAFLQKTTEFIRNNGLDNEGIFRLSGRKMLIEQIRESADQGVKIVFNASTDAHSVAGVLKLWFRELPDPLISLEMCDSWKVLNENDSSALDEKLEMLKHHLSKLSQNRKFVLQHLMLLLYEISQKSEINKMTPSNLGIVFGPNLVKKRAHGAAVDSYEPESQSRADLIAFLIEHYTSLFESIQREREQRAEAKKRMWSAPLNHRNREYTNTGMRRMKSEFLTRRGGSVVVSPSEDSDQASSPSTSTASSSSASPPPVIPLQEKTKEGWLKKKGGRRSNWKNRWFVLKYKSLSYFKNPTDVKPKGRIVLRNCVIGTSTRKPFCFCISTKEEENRTYLLVAKDDQEKQEWMNAIVQCIEQNSENLGLTDLTNAILDEEQET